MSKRITSEGYELDPDTRTYAYEQWIKIVRRILLRARTYGHGGAFLFTNTPKTSKLNMKYTMNYSRLPRLFENLLTSSGIEHQSSDLIHDHYSNKEDYVPDILYLDNVVAKDRHEDASEALSGAIAYVASLSRIDGLVLLDYDLVVHGFGCEITAMGNKKRQAYHSTHSTPTRGSLRQLDIDSFGTRHRSMVRYCSVD